jgi:hypothetical protein
VDCAIENILFFKVMYIFKGFLKLAIHIEMWIIGGL